MDLVQSPDNDSESLVSIAIELAAMLLGCVNSISNGLGSSLMYQQKHRLLKRMHQMLKTV
jgi:hypothetical protein